MPSRLDRIEWWSIDQRADRLLRIVLRTEFGVQNPRHRWTTVFSPDWSSSVVAASWRVRSSHTSWQMISIEDEIDFHPFEKSKDSLRRSNIRLIFVNKRICAIQHVGNFWAMKCVLLGRIRVWEPRMKGQMKLERNIRNSENKNVETEMRARTVVQQ